jgi:hypothetical protein
MKETGSDFAAVLGQAQQIPSGTEGAELPDGFPFQARGHHRVISEKDGEGISGVAAYDFKVFRRVFLIHRPWESCDRCRDAIANGVVALPDVGDYECPHTALKDYQLIVNQTLEGKLLHGGEQEIVNKDGSVAVSLRWYESTLNKKRLQRMQKEKRRQDASDY